MIGVKGDYSRIIVYCFTGATLCIFKILMTSSKFILKAEGEEELRTDVLKGVHIQQFLFIRWNMSGNLGGQSGIQVVESLIRW